MPALTLVPLFGFVLFARRYFCLRDASAMLHAAAAILLILYVSAVANVLLWGAALLLVIGTVLAIYEATRLRHTDAVGPGIGVFVVLCGVFWLLHRNGQFAYYDEYAHWGIYIKELLATHQLWGAETNAMHARYVPGPPLWQYLFVVFSGYSDGAAYLASFCLLLAPLLVLFEGLKWRQYGWMLGLFALLVIGMANFGHGFASLYMDHVISAWFAGIVFNFMLDVSERKPLHLLSYCLPVAALVLIKDVGLLFAMGAIGIMAALVVGQTWTREAAGGSRRLAVPAGLAVCWLLAAAAVTVTWGMNRDAQGIAKATVSLDGIARGILTGESNLAPEQRSELNRRFVDVLLHHQISKDETSAMYNAFSYETMPQFKDRFRLTAVVMLLLFIVWVFVALRWLVPSGDRWRWGVTAAGLMLTTIGYLAILFLSYRFAFGDRALGLSSFTRYAHTALLPMLLFCFLFLLPRFNKAAGSTIAVGDLNLPRGGVICAALLAILYAVETPYLEPLYRASEPPPARAQLAPLTETVAAIVGGDSLWIFFPIPDSNGLYGRILRFMMVPVRTDVSVDPALLSDDPQAVERAAAAFDYLWFPIPHPEMDAVLESTVGADLGDRLFRVKRQNGQTRLTPLRDVFN